MPPSRVPVSQRILLTVIALAVAAWLITFELAQPLSMDHGIFTWGGHVLSHGGVMYRDTWDHKGPLPYYFAGWVEMVFGRTEWGFRLFDMAWQTGACVLIYATLRRLGTRSLAATAGVLVFIAWYVALDFANSDQPDGWVAVLMALMVFLLITRPRSAFVPWLCGALVSICCLMKINFGMFLLLPMLYAPSLREPLRWLAFMVKLGIGWLVPMLLSIAFFATHGILRDYYVASIGYNLVYANTQAFPWPIRLEIAFKMLFLSIRLALPTLLAIYGVARLARRDRRNAVLIGTWIVLTLINVCIQGKIVWLYHWLPVYPALAIGAGIGIDAVLACWGAYRLRQPNHMLANTAVAVGTLAVVATIGLPAARNVLAWTIHEVHGSPTDGYDQNTYGMWGHGPNSVEAASRYIAAHTKPDQFVLFGSSFVLGNYLSDRWNPTRLTEARPYMDTPVSPYTKEFLDEFLHGLQIHPPAYIVQASSELCKTDGYEARYCVQHLPPMQELLSRCYTKEQEIGGLDIWRRTCPNGPAARPAPDLPE